MSHTRSLTAIVWSTLNATATVLLPFVTFIYFARTTTPALIGIIALAMAGVELLKTTGMQGIYEALLQQPAEDQQCHETAMAMALLGGIGAGAIYLTVLIVIALVTSDLSGHIAALAALGLRIPIDLAVLQPQAALAQRQLYRRLAVRTLVANSGASLLGVGVGVTMDPFNGMIVYYLSLSLLTFVSTFLGTGLIRAPRLHADAYRRMASEAQWSTAVRFVAASVNNLDQLIVACVASPTQLAFFNLGRRIETSFVSIANSFTVTMFQPLFVPGGGRSAPGALSRCVAVMTVICGIPAACLTIKYALLLPVLFGPQWTDAWLIIRLMALSGLLRAIACVPGALMSVSGHNNQLFIVSVASAAGTAAAAGLAPFGVALCAAGLIVKNTMILALIAWFQRDQIPNPFRLYAWFWLFPFALMLGVLWATGGVERTVSLIDSVPTQFVWLALGFTLSLVTALAWFGTLLRSNDMRRISSTLTRKLGLRLPGWPS
jgi:O-antigen/teichoic acid export membrane protein